MTCVDYSSYPGAAALQAAGVTLAARYFNPGYPKCITAAEASALTGAGIGIIPICETSATFMESSAASVRSIVQGCLDTAQTVGVSIRTLYLACDTQIPTAQYPTVAANLAAAQQLVPSAGLYGDYALIEWLKANHPATYFWQTLAWSGGFIAGGLALYQNGQSSTINGVQVDLNTVYLTDVGQTPAPTIPPLPPRGNPMSTTYEFWIGRTPDGNIYAISPSQFGYYHIPNTHDGAVMIEWAEKCGYSVLGSVGEPQTIEGDISQFGRPLT